MLLPTLPSQSWPYSWQIRTSCKLKIISRIICNFNNNKLSKYSQQPSRKQMSRISQLQLTNPHLRHKLKLSPQHPRSHKLVLNQRPMLSRKHSPKYHQRLKSRLRPKFKPKLRPKYKPRLKPRPRLRLRLRRKLRLRLR